MTGRALAAAIAAPIAVFLTLIGGFAMMFGGSGAAACATPAASNSPAASTVSTVTSEAVVARGRAEPASGTAGSTVSAASPAASVPGFDQSQVANANAIVTTGAKLGVPVRGWIIAVATAIQESSLRNLRHGDSAGPDSLGLFQQRDAWGPRASRLDPAKASRMFYLGGAGGQDGLLDITGWQTMPLTQAAQAVQHSGHPQAYAAHEVEATTLVAALTGLDTGSQIDQIEGQAGGLAGGLAGLSAAGFGGATSCSQPGSAAAAQAVAFARQQIGVPYRWGGNGPADGGFDCSGLTTAAYAAAGIRLPRTAQTQYNAGPLLSPADDLRPGDLLFFGTNSRHVTHVGIYVGDNHMIDAPHTGATVRTQDYRWSNYLGASRPA